MRFPALFMVFVLVLCPVSALSQQALPSAPDVSSWRPVQDIPVGASLHMRTTSRGLTCRVKSVDAGSITCANADTPTFQKSEIKSIKRVRHGRSALAGLLIGAGAGAIIGAAAGGSSCSAQEKTIFLGCFNVVSRTDVALVSAVVLGVIGAPVGYWTDFTRSPVYQIH